MNLKTFFSVVDSKEFEKYAFSIHNPSENIDDAMHWLLSFVAW